MFIVALCSPIVAFQRLSLLQVISLLRGVWLLSAARCRLARKIVCRGKIKLKVRSWVGSVCRLPFVAALRSKGLGSLACAFERTIQVAFIS